MRSHVVRARADVVATKLGIIFSFFFFPITFGYDFEFLHAFLSIKKNKIYPPKNGEGPPLHSLNRYSWVNSRRSVCAMGK